MPSVVGLMCSAFGISNRLRCNFHGDQIGKLNAQYEFVPFPPLNSQKRYKVTAAGGQESEDIPPQKILLLPTAKFPIILPLDSCDWDRYRTFRRWGIIVRHS